MIFQKVRPKSRISCYKSGLFVPIINFIYIITKKEILQYLHYNPLSKRTEIGRAQTVDSIDYKKAMLMFYEQSNIASFKQIFIDQFLFAVKPIFRKVVFICS